MDGFFRLRTLIGIIILSVSLSGCVRRSLEPFIPPPNCPAPDTINAPLCPDKKPCSRCMFESLLFYLRSHDVQVVRVGEDVRIIIPSDHLFKPYSANFKREYLPVLSAISTLLSCYEEEEVKVAGYTDCFGSMERNVMLSTLQAEKVEKFIWRAGVDSRLFYTKGYGPLYPIASYKHYYGRARNRRIEMTFRRLN